MQSPLVAAMTLGPRNSALIAFHPNTILRVDVQGKALCEWKLLHGSEIRALFVCGSPDKVLVCCVGVLQTYSLGGRLLRACSICSNPGPITANEDYVYIADYTKKCVRAYKDSDSESFVFKVRALDLQSLVVCESELFLAEGWMAGPGGVYVYAADDGTYLRALYFEWDIWNLAMANDGLLAVLFSSGQDIAIVNLDGHQRKRATSRVGTQFLVFTDPILVSRGHNFQLLSE